MKTNIFNNFIFIGAIIFAATACSGNDSNFNCSEFEPGAFEVQYNLVESNNECKNIKKTIVVFPNSSKLNDCQIGDTFVSDDMCNINFTTICDGTVITESLEILSNDKGTGTVVVRENNVECVYEYEATRL